jgi:DNA repair exonuclease SbcCD ATPase subunit
LIALAAAGLAAPFAAAGCGKKAAPPKTKAIGEEWSPEEIAEDPDAYFQWADAQIRDQVAQREALLKTIAAKRPDIEARRKQRSDDIAELENFMKRLETAVRRAEDEDRWPVQVGPHRYERERARTLLQTIPKQVDLRRPLAQEYEKAAADMDQKAQALRAQIASLGELRETVALHAERARISKGVDDLTRLGRAATEIANFSRSLGTMGEGFGIPASATETPVIPVGELLK